VVLEAGLSEGEGEQDARKAIVLSGEY